MQPRKCITAEKYKIVSPKSGLGRLIVFCIVGRLQEVVHPHIEVRLYLILALIKSKQGEAFWS